MKTYNIYFAWVIESFFKEIWLSLFIGHWICELAPVWKLMRGYDSLLQRVKLDFNSLDIESVDLYS